MARLQIEGLSKHFGPTVAVRDVSLDVRDGEFVVLLGPSGCGKTTTLRMIAGFITPTSGRVRLGGQDVTALAPWKRNAGMVFQSYALFPHLTVAQNVAFGLEMRRVPKAEIGPRTAEALRLVRLGGLSERLPRQLSGGQQQRVALARALATSPGLLLLDEPLSALDAKVRVHLRHEVKQLQRRLGVTTIMVTHDQEEALTMADRIVVMNRGAIEQIGAPLQIYREPASPFVADFIGVMNFVGGTVVREGAVRLGATELACTTDGLAPGTDVTLAVRPEDLVVQEASGRELNAFPGRVDALTFLGSFFRADLVSDALGSVLLRADLPVDLVRRLGIAEKSTLAFLMPPERIRIYPGSALHR